MNIYKYAAIDIGTNACRLLIMNVLEEGEEVFYQKDLLVRVPLRLGEDVFQYNEVRKERFADFVESMKAYRHLMDVYEVMDYRACATSAMREASNGRKITHMVKRMAHIDIEIIEGHEEAEILYSTHISRILEEGKAYLYVDVGGGSTELTLFSDKKPVASHSFNLGTIRMLRNQVGPEEKASFEDWLTTNVGDKYPNLEVIGSGGNINKLFKEAEVKRKKPFPEKKLREVYENIRQYTVEERMRAFGFKADRADVIIPASEIYLKVLGLTNATEIHVPKIGLADGIIRQLYKKNNKNTVKPGRW